MSNFRPNHETEMPESGKDHLTTHASCYARQACTFSASFQSLNTTNPKPRVTGHGPGKVAMTAWRESKLNKRRLTKTETTEGNTGELRESGVKREKNRGLEGDVATFSTLLSPSGFKASANFFFRAASSKYLTKDCDKRDATVRNLPLRQTIEEQDRALQAVYASSRTV
jgi:hypothetical protein